MLRAPSLVAFLSLLLLHPAGVAAANTDPLEGRWCLTDVATVDGSRSRSIGREWIFAPGGRVRVQSEASPDVRMSVRYRLDQGRLIVPDLDLRLDIERRDDKRMSALGRGGNLRYTFRRGRCSESDREAGEESRSAGDDGGDDRDDARRRLP